MTWHIPEFGFNLTSRLKTAPLTISSFLTGIVYQNPPPIQNVTRFRSPSYPSISYDDDNNNNNNNANNKFTSLMEPILNIKTKNCYMQWFQYLYLVATRYYLTCIKATRVITFIETFW